MSVRAAYVTDDTQMCLFKMLSAYTASPWSRWSKVLGWPEAKVFETFTKPFIYILEPQITSQVEQFGGGLRRYVWETIIGFWDHRTSGGMEECNIGCSHLINLFGDPQTVHAKTFTVTLGDTTYTDTTLKAQGIRIRGIVGPRDLSNTTDVKEFRKEMTITLIA